MRTSITSRYVTRIKQCAGKDYCRLEELEALLNRMVPESEWEHKCKGIFRLPKDHIGFGIPEVGCRTPGVEICSSLRTVSVDTISKHESSGMEKCPGINGFCGDWAASLGNSSSCSPCPSRLSQDPEDS